MLVMPDEDCREHELLAIPPDGSITLSHLWSFRSGDVLEVRMLVPENQRKQYSYRGVCIARYNKGIRSSFKLYNVYPDAGPVVQV